MRPGRLAGMTGGTVTLPSPHAPPITGPARAGSMTARITAAIPDLVRTSRVMSDNGGYVNLWIVVTIVPIVRPHPAPFASTTRDVGSWAGAIRGMVSGRLPQDVGEFNEILCVP